MKYLNEAPVLCVRNAGNGDARIVFQLGAARRDGVAPFVVVKFFGDRETVSSVKFWNNASLAKTAGYWNTKLEFDPSEQTVRAAREAILTAVSNLRA